jgi:hypothetical protein
MKIILRKALLVLFLGALAGAISGCSTTEPENQSAIPWNSPKGWEHGLPSGINPGQPY